MRGLSERLSQSPSAYWPATSRLRASVTR
jgi:hypothetical protein